MTPSDDYDALNARSHYMHDLKQIVRVAEAMKDLEKLPIDDLSVTVLDETGTYTAGTIWWDSESESLRIDMNKNGEC